MKKYIATLVLVLLCTGISYAQDNDHWVGTWTSEIFESYIGWDESKDEPIYVKERRVIRISRQSDLYQVRSKIIRVGDPDFVAYSLPMVVIKVDNDKMWIESYLEKEPSYDSNGKLEMYTDLTYRNLLSIKNGILHYSEYEYYAKVYNPRMQYIGDRTHKFSGNGRSLGLELDLFNDEW